MKACPSPPKSRAIVSVWEHEGVPFTPQIESDRLGMGTNSIVVKAPHLPAPLAQSVERLPFKQVVAGSSPAGGTNKIDTQQFKFAF